jgi:apolipoprotein N-acyltransferase
MPETAAFRLADRGWRTVLPRLADQVRRRTGWRRAVLALLLGLLAAPAMPPFNLVPLLVPSFTGLLWLLDGAPTRRRAGVDGWLWGMGFFVPNLSWVAAAMFVDLAQFWWMIPVSVLGLPAAVSLFSAAACALCRTLPARGLGRIWLFAICWTLAEWLRGRIPFGGFPWALIGYAWSSDSAVALDLMQTASLFGVYGLGFFTVLIAASPARFGDSLPVDGSFWKRLDGVALAAVLLLAGILWGAERLAHGVAGDVPGVQLRIVQTDVANRNDGQDRQLRLDRTVALARRPGAEAATAQIWPESAVDYYLDDQPQLAAAIGALTPPDGLVLTGTALAHRDRGTEHETNSVAALSPQGGIVGSYDKAHLVPFGEYIPLRWLLGFIPAVAERGSGWATGPGARTLHLPNLPPVAVIICYEAVFPHAVIDEADRPGWLLNDTNDAWFGRSIGPDQHFALARLRTVEEGLPLIRAANGGISGVVDAYGRRVITLPPGQEAALDVKLPVALPTNTPYGTAGDAPLLLIVLLTLLTSARRFMKLSENRY